MNDSLRRRRWHILIVLLALAVAIVNDLNGSLIESRWY
jgi:hypothetical protein